MHKVHIDPTLFRPLKMSLEDLESDMGISVKYGNFKSFGEKMYPEDIEFNVVSDDLKIKLGPVYIRQYIIATCFFKLKFRIVRLIFSAVFQVKIDIRQQILKTIKINLLKWLKKFRCTGRYLISRKQNC